MQSALCAGKAADTGELAVLPLQLHLQGLPVPRAWGKNEHGIHLPFGVAAGELLSEPMKSTTHSVPKNVPFPFLPDTPSYREWSHRWGRGRLQFQKASGENSFTFILVLNFPINGREENTSKQKSHPSTQSTRLGSLMVFELHPWLMSQICHLQLRKGKRLCCDLHAVIRPSHKPHWFQAPWPRLPAPRHPLPGRALLSLAGDQGKTTW